MLGWFVTYLGLCVIMVDVASVWYCGERMKVVLCRFLWLFRSSLVLVSLIVMMVWF